MKNTYLFRWIAAACWMASAALPALADGGVTFTDIAAGGGAGLAYSREPSARFAIAEDFYADGLVNVAEEYLIFPYKPHGAPGVALLDYDGDGDLDLYVTNGPGAANSLFSNQLRETGAVTFVDVAAAAGVTATAQDSQGTCFGDIDNDGDEDLYVLGMNEPNHLFENQGDGTFADITAASGAGGSNRSGASCSLGDVNGDGRLDIFVANTFDLGDQSTFTFIPYTLNQHNQLFVNTGGNVFSNASAASGLETIPNVSVPGAAMVTWPAAVVDFDQDGDADVQMAGDLHAQIVPEDLWAFTHLYENDGSGHFTNASAELGIDRLGSWRGVSWGDLDCDRRLDFFATNWGDYVFFPGTIQPGQYSSAWFLQQANGTFSDPGPGALVTVPTGWGTSITDYDNDGDLDIIAYGNPEDPLFLDFSNPGVILQNQGCSASFTWDQAALAGSSPHGRRGVQGLATGDLNDDGFPDIVSVSGHDVPADAPRVPFFFNPIGSVFDPTGLGIFSTIPTADPLLFQVIWYEPTKGTLSVELNSGGNGNRWVKVDTLGTVGITTGGQANRDGIGAVVTFTPAPGTTPVTRPVSGGSSYASQDSTTLGFGLGTGRRGSVDVLWPGGVRNRLYGVKASEHVVFPEIPCSFTADWDNAGQYLGCLFGAIDELEDAGVIQHGQALRFIISAIQAYLVERALPF